MEGSHSFNRDLLYATEPSGYHTRSGSSCSSLSYASDVETVPLNNIHQVTTTRVLSFWTRLGLFYSVSLIISTISLLSSFASISFLWFGNDSNITWKFLASEDWITKAVAVSSLLLRTSITLQAGIATAILASIALENFQVLLAHLASISTMRNSNSGPYNLAWLFLSPVSIGARGWRGLLLTTVIAILALVTFLSQLTSTALLSDVSSGLVSGFPHLSPLPTSLLNGFAREFLSTSTNSVWLRRPSVFAPFAEETPAASSGPGFEDTGSTLRAFLPVADQSDRILLKSYIGSATVVDTRVVCFTPQVTQSSLLVQQDFFELSGNIVIPQSVTQAYQKLEGNYPRLIDYSSQPGGRLLSFNGTSFKCQANPDAFMTMCQLSGRVSGSFLVGELQMPPKSNNTWSLGYDTANQYMVLKTNKTGYVQNIKDLRNVTRYSPIKNHTQTPWLYTSYRGTNGDGIRSRLDLSMSLCYDTLSGVDIPITAISNMTRSEALPAVNNGAHNFSSIIAQLGVTHSNLNSKPMSPNERGLLQLTFPTGRPNGSIPTSIFSKNSDYIVNSVQQLTAIAPFVSNGATSIQFSQDASVGLTAHTDYTTFLNQTLNAGGNLATAMQSLITLLVGSAYYDQLPNFNNNTVIQRTDFVQAQIPAGKSMEYSASAAGFQRGYVGVLVLTVVHVVLMLGVILWFQMGTKISRLGNAWQTVAQIHDPVTEKYISSAFLASDSEVEREMMRDGRGDQIVAIGYARGGQRTCVKGMKPENIEKENVMNRSRSRSRSRSTESVVIARNF